MLDGVVLRFYPNSKSDKMPRNRVCCVCGVKEVDLSTENSRSFFAFPKIDKRLNNPNDVELLQRRIASWKNVVGKNIYKYYGTPSVCSEHFHSGIFR